MEQWKHQEKKLFYVCKLPWKGLLKTTDGCIYFNPDRRDRIFIVFEKSLPYNCPIVKRDRIHIHNWCGGA